ncbi:MAG: Mur ligase family protein [Adlercreutzia equolifaciens]
MGVPAHCSTPIRRRAVVVVEMGMRGRGQIAELCDFVRPVWGLITNVGESHIELLGSRENIARPSPSSSRRFPPAWAAPSPTWTTISPPSWPNADARLSAPWPSRLRRAS